MVLLPYEFAHLTNLTDWIKADDVARSLKIEAASSEMLQVLVSRVSAAFPAINAWLDAHNDEDAHSLGRLAEAACEAQLELRQRATNA